MEVKLSTKIYHILTIFYIACEYYCSKCENSSGNCLECKAEENRQKSMPCQCNQGYYSN